MISYLKRHLYPSHLYSFGSDLKSLLGHPYWLARRALYNEISNIHHKNYSKILDVGCGSMPYRAIFLDATVYHGLEIDQGRNRLNSNVTHFYDGRTFPFYDNAYDFIICSQVLEHAFEPDLLLSEIYRVLEPGGSLLLTIPFFWPEHEQPYDSQRFTSFGLIRRLEKLGFHSITVFKTNPGLSCLVQLAIEWAESHGRRFHGRLASHWRLAMALPYTIMNLIGFLYRSLPQVNRNRSKAELYLDLVVLAQR